ncbi:hypothetical protein B0H10DRAFT_2017559, partial [Mycena sp. CBHHK59/15]
NRSPDRSPTFHTGRQRLIRPCASSLPRLSCLMLHTPHRDRDRPSCLPQDPGW